MPMRRLPEIRSNRPPSQFASYMAGAAPSPTAGGLTSLSAIKSSANNREAMAARAPLALNQAVREGPATVEQPDLDRLSIEYEEAHRAFLGRGGTEEQWANSPQVQNMVQRQLTQYIPDIQDPDILEREMESENQQMAAGGQSNPLNQHFGRMVEARYNRLGEIAAGAAPPADQQQPGTVYVDGVGNVPVQGVPGAAQPPAGQGGNGTGVIPGIRNTPVPNPWPQPKQLTVDPARANRAKWIRDRLAAGGWDPTRAGGDDANKADAYGNIMAKPDTGRRFYDAEQAGWKGPEAKPTLYNVNLGKHSIDQKWNYRGSPHVNYGTGEPTKRDIPGKPTGATGSASMTPQAPGGSGGADTSVGASLQTGGPPIDYTNVKPMPMPTIDDDMPRIDDSSPLSKIRSPKPL